MNELLLEVCADDDTTQCLSLLSKRAVGFRFVFLLDEVLVISLKPTICQDRYYTVPFTRHFDVHERSLLGPYLS